MDVAHVSTVHKATDNRIAKKECAGLALAGVSVCFIVPSSGTDQVDGVPIVELPMRRGRLARSVIGSLDAWRALRRVRPRLIHVHDPELVPLAVLYRAFFRARAVYDSHEDLPKQIEGKTYIRPSLRKLTSLLGRTIEYVADKMLDGIVAATPSIARNFSNTNTILVQNYPWRHAFENNYRAELPKTACAGYVGAITPVRGSREMVEAVERAVTTERLVLAGPVSTAAQQDLNSRPGAFVEYLGTVAPSEIPDILRDVSVGLVLFHPLPNHYESQPTKLFEYMAAGRPFIASNFEFWIEKFARYECGIFVDPLDVSEIAGAIDDLLQDPHKVRTMGQNGRAAVLENFVFDTQMGALLALTTRLSNPDNGSRTAVTS